MSHGSFGPIVSISGFKEPRLKRLDLGGSRLGAREVRLRPRHPCRRWNTVSGALAAEGISANVVAAYRHGHVFVPWDRRLDALKALQECADRMRGAWPGGGCPERP